MRVSAALIALIAFFNSASATADTNGLDQSFGVGGVFLLGPTPSSAITMGTISAISLQSDGKIIIGGRALDTSPSGGEFLPAIGRLNADGNWDITFGDHGIFLLPYGATSAPYGGAIHNVAVLTDGSIIAVGGAYTQSNFEFQSCALVVKLSSAGALSSSFGSNLDGAFCFDFAIFPNPSSNAHFEGVQVDSDDSFYLTMPSINADSGAVAHFNSLGILIPTYGTNGISILPTGIFSWLLQLLPSHQLLVPGIKLVPSPAIDYQIAVVRLNVDGSVDDAYATDGVYTVNHQNDIVQPQQVSLDSRGRLLIADNDFTGSEYLPYRFARVTDAGTADLDFNGSEQQPGYAGFAIPVVSGNYSNNEMVIAAQPLIDGHIFAVGIANHLLDTDGLTDIALLRLNDDSSYDTSFGEAAHRGWASLNIGAKTTSSSFAKALAIDPFGHAFVAISIDADANDNFCSGLLRIVSDRLSNDGFDSGVAFPVCPQ